MKRTALFWTARLLGILVIAGSTTAAWQSFGNGQVAVGAILAILAGYVATDEYHIIRRLGQEADDALKKP